MRRKQLTGKNIPASAVHLVKGNSSVNLLKSDGKSSSLIHLYTNLNFAKDSYYFFIQSDQDQVKKGDLIYFNAKLVRQEMKNYSGKEVEVSNILTVSPSSEPTDIIFAIVKEKFNTDLDLKPIWFIDSLSFEFPFIKFLNGLTVEVTQGEGESEFNIDLQSERKVYSEDTEIDTANPPKEIIFTFAKEKYDAEMEPIGKEGGYF